MTTKLAPKEAFSHEQNNTRHEVSAIPIEVCKETWCSSREPKIQQRPVIHILLAKTIRRQPGIAGLSIAQATQPSEPAHRGRNQTHPKPAAKKPGVGIVRVVVSRQATWICPATGKHVSGDAAAWDVSADRGKEKISGQTLRTNAISRPARPSHSICFYQNPLINHIYHFAKN